MKTIILITAFGVSVWFTAGIMSLFKTPRSKPCDCDKVGFEPQVHIKPKEQSLISALQSLGINHNTKAIAKYVIENHPNETDLEELLNLSFKSIRQKYLENNLLF